MTFPSFLINVLFKALLACFLILVPEFCAMSMVENMVYCFIQGELSSISLEQNIFIHKYKLSPVHLAWLPQVCRKMFIFINTQVYWC